MRSKKCMVVNGDSMDIEYDGDDEEHAKELITELMRGRDDIVLSVFDHQFGMRAVKVYTWLYGKDGG